MSTNFLPPKLVLFLFLAAGLIGCTADASAPATPTSTSSAATPTAVVPTITPTAVPPTTAPTATPSQPPPAIVPAPTDTPLPPPDLANAGPLALLPVGRVGQPMERFAVGGDFVYVAAGMELLTIDFSDPADPQQTNALTLPGLKILQMAVDGRTLLVSTIPYATVDVTPYSVRLLDLSAPAAPQLAGEIELTNVHPGAFAANGYYFALTGGGLYFPLQLQVGDVSDPFAPQQTAVHAMSDLFGQESAADVSMVLVDGAVYLAAGEQIWTLDAANPAAPPQTAAAPPPEPPLPSPYKLLPDALQRRDLIDPANPVVIGAFTRPVFAAYDVAAVGDFLYVASEQALLALDLSDPPAPRLAQTFPANVQRLFTVGPYLGALAHAPAQLRFWDTAVAPNLSLISSTEIPVNQPIQDIATANGRLLIATKTGLTIVDITNLNAPQVIAHWPAPALINGVTAVGDAVYLALDDGLHILDISTPASPQEIGQLSLFADPFTCAPVEPLSDPLALTDALLVGEYVYAAAVQGCMGVIDVTNPGQPGLVAAVPFVFSSYVNISLWQNRLIGFADYPALDIRQTISLFGWDSAQDVPTPVWAGEITLTESVPFPPHYATRGAYVYAAGGESGLIVIKAVNN